jgi:hypothetical protein
MSVLPSLPFAFLLILSIQTHEAYLDKWEVVNLNHTRMSAEEAEEREEVLAEVMDPVYLMGRDADADGDGDMEGEGEGEGEFGADVGDEKGLDLGMGGGGECVNGIGVRGLKGDVVLATSEMVDVMEL